MSLASAEKTASASGPEVAAASRGAQVAADPRLPGLAVEVLRLGVRPRLRRIDAAREPLPAGEALGEVGERDRVELRRGALVAAEARLLAAEIDEQLAGVVPCREGLEPEFVDERVHRRRGLRRSTCRRARPARPRVAALGTAADAVARLQHGHGSTGGNQSSCGAQASEPGTHHDNIGVVHASGIQAVDLRRVLLRDHLALELHGRRELVAAGHPRRRQDARTS